MVRAIRGRVGCTYPTGRKEDQLARQSGHHALVIASNRLPVRLHGRRTTGSTCSASAGGLVGRARGDARATRPGSGGRAPSFRRRCRSACAQRLAQGQPRTRSSSPPTRRRTSTAGSATTRSGRSSTTSRTGCASRPRRGSATSRSTSASRTRSSSTASPDARVWVHDFHLMLVPAMLRRRAPRPLDRVLPAHAVPVVRGLPAASRARAAPARACSARTTSASRSATTRATSARRACAMLGIDSRARLARARRSARRDRRRPDRDRRRRLPRGASPSPETARLLADLERQYEGRRLVLGVERLDYTKGIPQKLHAFERFLEQDPERARTTTMIQVRRAVAAREPRVPRAARRDRAPHRPDQRPVRSAGRRRRSSTCTATSRSRRSSRSTGVPT